MAIQHWITALGAHSPHEDHIKRHANCRETSAFAHYGGQLAYSQSGQPENSDKLTQHLQDSYCLTAKKPLEPLESCFIGQIRDLE